MTVINVHAKISGARISHSLKCPLGGGFWVNAPEHGCAANVDEHGNPVCTCGAPVHLKFEDGTEVVIHNSDGFMEHIEYDLMKVRWHLPHRRRVADADALLQHGRKHWLKIARRAADDFQHF